MIDEDIEQDENSEWTKRVEPMECKNHIICHCICHNSLVGKSPIAKHCFPCCRSCSKCGMERVVR